MVKVVDAIRNHVSGLNGIIDVKVEALNGSKFRAIVSHNNGFKGALTFELRGNKLFKLDLGGLPDRFVTSI